MADIELANWRSGISINLGVGDGSDKGTAYMEEYLYWDKTVTDKRVIYLRSSTPISFEHNVWNKLSVGPNGPDQPLSMFPNGLDGVPNSGDENNVGIIRYLVDRSRNDLHRWGAIGIVAPAFLLPAYSTPLTFDTLTYPTSAGPAGGGSVLGTTGPTGTGNNLYYRGIIDDFGDEWHTIAVGDDDSLVMPNQKAEQQASDGKEFLFVVNPKGPAMTVRATGGAQFHTRAPKAYDVPKVHPQETRFTVGGGSVTFELRDIFGRNISYRINGGSWVSVGASSITLSDTAFVDGSNTLEYRSAGFEANARTRAILKNPDHPSKAEPHGNFLWGSEQEYNRLVSRVHPTPRQPYTSAWNDYLNNDGVNMHGYWDANGLGMARRPFFQTTPYYYSNHQAFGGSSLPNAVVAAVKGWTFTRSGKAKSYGQYAKEMLLHNVWSRVDPIRLNGNQATGANPSTEVIGAGYYMVNTHFDALPTYDIIAGRFRSDQVTGGLTPIEDYYIRDSLALHAMWMIGGMTSGYGGSPGLWGTARIAGAMMFAMIMSEYSSPVYGVSGYGLNQTPYPWTPDPAYAYTHKTIWGTTKYQSATYPGSTLPVFDPEENALWRAGGVWGGPNAGYFNLLSESLMVITNLNRRYNPSVVYPVMEQGLLNAINEQLFTIATKARVTFGSGASALTFTAQVVGATELATNITIVAPSVANASLVVGVVGRSITINLGSDGSGVANSTAAQVKAACDASPACLALVATAISSGGTGVVAAASTKNLLAEYNALTLLGNAYCGSLGTACVQALKTRGTESTQIRGAMKGYGVVWYDDELVSLTPTAPTITSHPASQTITTGQPVTFAVVATGTNPFTYQWRKDGVNIGGATNSTYTISSTNSGSAGVYSVVVTNSVNSVTSNGATLTIQASSTVPPTVTVPPANLTVTEGQSASFSVTATGSAPFSYQWKKNGTPIVGATSATYSIPSTTLASAGSYSVDVSNLAGTATSAGATLTVNAASVAPTITQQPATPINITAPSSVMFSVTATGTATLSYQWRKNATNIIGATSATYTIASTVEADSGSYTCVVSNGVGSVTSSAAVLTVAPYVAPQPTTLEWARRRRRGV